MNLVTVHRDAERPQFFAARQGGGLFFDTQLGAWVAATPETCDAVLRSRDVRVSHYTEDYEALARRGEAFDFPNMRFAFQHLPMCLAGDRHKAARQRTAAFVAAARPRLVAALPDMIGRHLAPLDAAGRIEVMESVVRPLIFEFVGTLVGIGAGEPGLGEVSPAFDRMISLRRRRGIDRGIAAIRKAIRRDAGGDMTPEDEGVRLTLVIVGVDSLSGTLGDSLQTLFADNDGRRLDEIAYPAAPLATGVAFVERVAENDVTFGEVTVKRGQRIRVMLQAFQYSGNERDRLALFGVGPHLCLGRQLSLDLWSALCLRLSSIRRSVRVLSVSYRTDDYIFTHPGELTVEMSP